MSRPAPRRAIWPWEKPPAQEVPEGAGGMGLALFFVSLAVLFIASAVGVMVVRFASPASGALVSFPPIGWVSTGALVTVSLLVHLGVRAVRKDEQTRFRACTAGALAASLVFLGLQAFFWSELLLQEMALANAVESGLYAFFVLTGLHAAHVLGGVLMQSLVTVRAFRGAYWSLHHGQVRGTALYWHFIDLVWLVLVAFLVWFI